MSKMFGYDDRRREGVHVEVHIAYAVRGFCLWVSAVLAHPDTIVVCQAICAVNAAWAGCRNLISMGRFSKKINNKTSQQDGNYTHLLVNGVLICLSECKFTDCSSSSNTESIGTLMSSRLGNPKVCSRIISE
jgi:hypothetical protein